jgi:hypothetical protein
MTEQEIIDSICKVDGIRGMTVNERLFVSGLMDEYDKAKWNDKKKAKRILELICDEDLVLKRSLEENEAKRYSEIQKLKLDNKLANIELIYESYNSVNNVLVNQKYDKKIKLTETQFATSLLLIKTTTKHETKTCLISEIEGGIYLHTANKIDKSYSVKLEGKILYCSLGFTFIAFNIETQEIIWKIRPDTAEIFEFYDLDNDFLLRGELSMHRVDKLGKIKWQFGGRDIWVNIEEKKEVEILKDRIKLIDFESNEYEIDYNGNILAYIQNNKQIAPTKKWWKIW